MAQDLLEAGPSFGHGFRAGLAKSDAVAFPCSVQHDLIAFFPKNEVVAGNGIPA